jgi:hypothetical protein
MATTATTARTAKVTSPVVATAPRGSSSPVWIGEGGGRASGAVPRGGVEPAFDGPRGISPKEFQFGDSGSSLATVHGVVSAVLDTLAALVALAALIGAMALVRKVRSDRRSARRRAVATRANGGRTREQLYSEARRQNIKGRSRMNKAQLERALGPH